MEKKSERALLPDLLRGFAVILVVFGHCIQEGSGAAYSIEQQYFDDRLYQFIYSFHMPLFMMISGYLSWRGIERASERGGWANLLKRRAASLLTPVFAWTALDYVRILIINSLNGEPQPEALVFVYFYNALNNLWFLWAVWWCFLVVLVMHRFLRDNIGIYVLGFLALFVIPDGLGVGACKYMLPYFLFGYYMHDCMHRRGWKLEDMSRAWIVAGTGLVFAGLFLCYDRDAFIYLTGYKLIGKSVKEQLWIDLYRMLVGFAGSLFFVFLWQYIVVCFDRINGTGKMRTGCRVLQKLGADSMGIYILSGYLLIFLVHRLDFIDHPSYAWNVLETAAVILLSLCGTVLLGRIPVLRRLVGKQ